MENLQCNLNFQYDLELFKVAKKVKELEISLVPLPFLQPSRWSVLIYLPCSRFVQLTSVWMRVREMEWSWISFLLDKDNRKDEP